MAPRAYWKGFLRLSLVSCPIQLVPATSEREKITFNQINSETGNRIRYRKIDEHSGEEKLLENVSKSTRQRIRQAERGGLAVVRYDATAAPPPGEESAGVADVEFAPKMKTSS